MIDYYGYDTVEDERLIVLHKDLGFTVDLHVEVSEIFLLRGKGNIFIHVDCVHLVLEYITMAYFGLCFKRMNS